MLFEKYGGQDVISSSRLLDSDGPSMTPPRGIKKGQHHSCLMEKNVSNHQFIYIYICSYIHIL